MYPINKYCIFTELKDSEYTECGKLSNENDCLCQNHYYKKDDIDNIVRLNTKFILQLVTKLMEKLIDSNTISKKIVVFHELLDNLDTHQYFLKIHTELAKTVSDKINKYSYHRQLNKEKYMKLLFPKSINKNNDNDNETSEECDEENNETVTHITISI